MSKTTQASTTKQKTANIEFISQGPYAGGFKMNNTVQLSFEGVLINGPFLSTFHKHETVHNYKMKIDQKQASLIQNLERELEEVWPQALDYWQKKAPQVTLIMKPLIADNLWGDMNINFKKFPSITSVGSNSKEVTPKQAVGTVILKFEQIYKLQKTQEKELQFGFSSRLVNIIYDE